MEAVSVAWMLRLCFAETSACLNHFFAAGSSVSSVQLILEFFVYYFFYLFQRLALKALESIHASGRLVSCSEECVQPLTQVCQKQKKLHAAAFTSRSTKPRLASYWEAV